MGIYRVPAHWALFFYLIACVQWTPMLTISFYQQSASCSDGTTSDTTLCGHPVPVDSRSVRSLLDCASLCDGDPDCLGVSYGNGADVNSPQLTSCVHYTTSPDPSKQIPSSPDSVFLRDPSWGTTTVSPTTSNLADVVDSTTASGASTASHHTMSSAPDDEGSITEATTTTEASSTSVSGDTTAYPPFDGVVDPGVMPLPADIDTSSADETTTEARRGPVPAVNEDTTAYPPFNGFVDPGVMPLPADIDTSADETTTLARRGPAPAVNEDITTYPPFNGFVDPGVIPVLGFEPASSADETTTSPSVVPAMVSASSPDAFSTSETTESPVRCQNGGTLVRNTDTCNCASRWTGENCERRAHNCAELITDLISLNHNMYFLETLSYQNGGYFDVYCQKNPVTYSLNIFRNSGATRGAFNKTWQEYKDGFLNSKENFWIGLDTLHKLTHQQDSMNHKLWMEYIFSSSSLASIAWSFSDFKIGDESTGYQVTGLGDAERVIRNKNSVPDSAENIMGQCLDVTVGQQFSTYDQDNSANSSYNCAAAAGAGWWFTNCVDDCSPMGLSYRSVRSKSGAAEDHIRINGMDLVNGAYKNKVEHFRMALQFVR